ncbi:MAG: winged helix-turn-helix transcriptional regulator [Peptococcales bacterium]|jgi:DNA-binding Lrp family transcriptional regulator
MVNEELDILNIVAENPNTSQRKIAEQTGISLGQVNFLIKKFVKIGLIKIEGQTSKSLRYNLTPKGMAEKAEKTLQYIKASYAKVKLMSNRIQKLASTFKDAGYTIYLPEAHDEMMEICILALNDVNIDYRVGAPENYEEKAVILCWDPEVEKKYNQYTCVNVLH